MDVGAHESNYSGVGDWLCCVCWVVDDIATTVLLGRDCDGHNGWRRVSPDRSGGSGSPAAAERVFVSGVRGGEGCPPRQQTVGGGLCTPRQGRDSD